MPNPKPAEPQKQATPAAEPSAAFKWLPLPLALAMAHILPMKDAEAGRYIKLVLIALATRKRGECDLSDIMLEDAEKYSQTKREAANKRWQRDAGAMQVHTGALPNKQTHTTNKQDTQKSQECETVAACAATLSHDGTEIPSFEVFKAFGEEQGFDPETVRGCFDYYTASGWIDSKGNPVESWRGKLASWVANQKAIPATPKKPEPKPAASDREFRSSISPRIIGSDQ